MKTTLPILLSLLALVAGAALAAPELTLTRDGQPTASIVLAADPTKAALFAALELQTHVQKISGAILPIIKENEPMSGTRILVGESELTRALGFKNDDFGLREYAVKFLPDTLVLIGHDDPDRSELKYENEFAFENVMDLIFRDHGSAFAVYDFLEKCCGVRWYRPGPVGLCCPDQPTLAVSAVDIRRAPMCRYIDFLRPLPEGHDVATGMWRSEAPARAEIQKLLWEELYPRIEAGTSADRRVRRKESLLHALRMRGGGERYTGNHSFYGYYDRFWEKNPDKPERWEEARPEYFAVGYKGKPPHMSYINRGFIDQVIKDAREYFDTGKKYPGAMAFGDYFAIVPMDGSAYSKAPEDQALMNQEELANRMFSNGRWSEYIWGFTNEVAREIRKTHPDKYLVQLAYAKYAYYPQGFRVEPNVAVQVCLSSRGWWCPAVEANDTKVLREWGTKEPGRPIYMFNYYCFPNDYTAYREGQGWHVFPAFFAHTAARQAQLYKQYGVRGIYYCGVPTAPDDYFVTKLYDDPDLDIDAMLEEYFQLYYGAAAEPMKQMYLRIESLFSDPKNYPLSIQLDQQNYRQSEQFAWGCVGTAERMAELQKLMEQAQAQAQTEMEKRRVRIFEREIWDYMVEGRRKYEARAPEGSLASLSVPKVAGAGGDAQQVNWAEAALLDGPWYHEGGSLASRRSLGGRVAHDGEYLYVELTEKCDTAKLQASPQVYPFDTWEVLVGRRRALPYREYAVGPTGMTVSLSNGEVEDRLHHPLEVPGWKASADPSAGDEWVAHLVFPLETIVAGGVRPGESLFVGVFRAESPALSGVSPVRVYSWARGCTWHDPTRMAEFKLAE